MVSITPTPQEIFEGHFFEEPLVPIGAEPTPVENTALATALQNYSKRTGPDDFFGLTGFLDAHPESPWNAALLTDLGLEYYYTGHYSKALEAWRRAWELANAATDPRGKAIADRAVGELAYLYARLGRMIDDVLCMNDPPTGGSHGKPHQTTKILEHAARRRGRCVAARGARPMDCAAHIPKRSVPFVACS